MHQIMVNELEVDVVRKNIKNLHLAVYPPDGRVRVAVPLRVDDEAVRLAVISRWSWIRRQQRKFKEQQRQSPREYISGESHYFQGQRYLLNVIYEDVPPKITLRNKTYIDLTVRPGTSVDQREAVMRAWYRQHLKESAAPLIAQWQETIGVQVDDWRIKQMKTKWGSCKIEARRIWLNLELAKKPMRCLEYIIIHELIHLLERHHNERFVSLMDYYLPSWRTLRDELNREPLAHEDWEY